MAEWQASVTVFIDEHWHYEESDDDWGDDPREDMEALCSCGRPTIGECCEQCGMPLCPMCFETGAGFCHGHPTEDYRPSYAL